MEFFQPVESATVLLRKQGTYRPSDLFVRGQNLYAKFGAGYIALRPYNRTSHADIGWSEIFIPETIGSYQNHGIDLVFVANDALAAAAE